MSLPRTAITRIHVILITKSSTIFQAVNHFLELGDIRFINQTIQSIYGRNQT